MKKPIAVVVGFIGKFPVAGMSLYNLHYIAGLQDLGYDVHYVERQNYPDECYDPERDALTDDPTYALAYLSRMLPQYGITPPRCSFIDRHNQCHLSSWGRLKEAIEHADFVITLADETWFDELASCPRRAFVDGDPILTQAGMANGDPVISQAMRNYPTLFTYGVRMGKPDCTVPDVGRDWLPTRPVVATKFWDPQPPADSSPLTSVLLWGGDEVVLDGQAYGHKNREFETFIDVPTRTHHSFVLAVGGPAPKDRLRDHGWRLVNPLVVTGTVDAYQDFITKSRADFGIVKHAYVASRSGWFSDRSTCYLASARPVLHQDTGCGDWLPAGEGVLLFSNVSELTEALAELDANYESHSRAARVVAEECFEAKKVLDQMLTDAGFR